MTMVYTSTTPRVTTPCPLVTNLYRCSRDSRPDDESRCSDIVQRGSRPDLGPSRGGAWLRGRLAYDKRSEERGVGKEGVSRCRCRGSQEQEKKTQNKEK